MSKNKGAVFGDSLLLSKETEIDLQNNVLTSEKLCWDNARPVIVLKKDSEVTIEETRPDGSCIGIVDLGTFSLKLHFPKASFV